MADAKPCCLRHGTAYVPKAAMLGAYAYAILKDDDQVYSVFYVKTEYGCVLRWRLTDRSPLHEIQFHETPEGLPN